MTLCGLHYNCSALLQRPTAKADTPVTGGPRSQKAMEASKLEDRISSPKMDTFMFDLAVPLVIETEMETISFDCPMSSIHDY